MGIPDRAVSVVFDADGAVLVVRRACEGRHYCVLPGGGVEVGEGPPAAALRELREETGLPGQIDHRLATFNHADRRAHYYLVTVDNLGTGALELRADSPERARHSPANRYRPAWIRASHLDAENLQPYEVRPLIAREASLRTEVWTSAGNRIGSG